jgi:hypothetical protein
MFKVVVDAIDNMYEGEDEATAFLCYQHYHMHSKSASSALYGCHVAIYHNDLCLRQEGSLPEEAYNLHHSD